MRGIVAIALCAGLTLSFPAAVSAAAPSCHCFRDREYDAANPAKSDVYLLATASNTLLSAAYGLPKRDIVTARMSGTSGEDLWVSSYIAQRQGTEAAALMKGRAAASSWREYLRSLGGPIEPLGARFVGALAGGADDVALAKTAAAETLAARLGTPWPQLDELTARGATLQEMVLASLLGLWSSRPAPEVYAEVKAGKSGWSLLLAAQGRVPKQMETEVPKALRSPGR